ncbi:MAG: efflux RND transporter permease subunit [Candidatus Latescibacterota bacterium]|nr:efflux RND transporter permease subunit [Candidatus Latescibacterota bacterium]
MNLSDNSSRFAITTRRPVAILMVVLAVCVFGWVSYQRLALNLMPDISYPTLTVRTEYPGTAPEEVETLLSRPLEQELGIVPHLVNISSISKAGQSDIILEFAWDTDMNVMSQEVREKADRVFLPQAAEKPLLLRYDPSLDPIMRIGLHGPQNLFALRYLAEHEIKRELEALAGVAAVKIKGGLEEEIHVALNERQISVMGLDIQQINQRLAQNNVNMPGGNLREGQVEYLIRTLNEFETVAEIADLIVVRQGDADVHLRDIAAVTRSHKDREIVTRVNGIESVEIEIYKEADANIVAVAERVRNVLYGLPQQREYVERLAREAEEQEQGGEEGAGAGAEEEDGGEGEKKDLKAEKEAAARKAIEHLRMIDFITHRLPEGAVLELLSDQSAFIENSITEVQTSALIGGAMAVVVLFIFLRNVIHTLIIGLTIPVSIVATFAPMFMFDVSLNIMSLGGLALGIGMLVDNSIVVLDSIFRCREEGDDLVKATIRGTAEVGTAVFASTLTTVTVFFPIVFVEGVAGQIFGDMALTVVFSLLASLGVALFFIPMLASRQLNRTGGLAEQVSRSDFLRPQALSRVRSVLGEEGSLWRKVIPIVLALPYLVYEILLRVLLAAATLVAAVLKAAFILVAELWWWLIKPVEHFWVKRERTFQHWFSTWAAESRVGKWTFFARVWPGILGFDSPRTLAETLQRYWRWGGGSKRLVWKVLKILLFPLVLAYLVVVRFVLGTVLRLVGIVLHVALMILGLVLVLALFLLGLVLMPFFLPLLFLFEQGFGLVQRAYPLLLGWALKQRLLIVGGALAALLFCWFKLLPELGTELIPQVHQAEFNLDLSLPVGTPLDKTAEVVRQIEDIASAQPEVERVATTVGTDRSASSSSEEGEHTAQVTIRMQEGSDAAQEENLIKRLRSQIRDIPEIEVEVSHPALFSFKTPVEVEVRGYDLRRLRQLSLEVESRLASLNGLVDVKSSLQAGNPELQISYKRERLAAYSLSLRNVAELVRHKVQGKVATDFRQDERQIDVLVRLREEDRLGLDELQRLVINPNAPIPIPLAAVADIRVNEGPSEIRRIDQQRAAVVTANIQGVDLGTASALIHDELTRMDFPTGFDFLISGQNEEMETSLQSLYFALGLAIFLVYVVMASQFESLVHPFIIMFTVPLALIGVVVALYLAQVPLSVVVFIGLIMLAGIVVNNAIVLVDYINILRRTGMEKTQAIIQAGAVRLRPITMTTATTVLGLLPMALGLGEGAEIRTPMALTVIAGLLSSTFLTLVVIPTVYSLVDRRPSEGIDGQAKPIPPAAFFGQPAGDGGDVADRLAGGGLYRLHPDSTDALSRGFRLAPALRLGQLPQRRRG